MLEIARQSEKSMDNTGSIVYMNKTSQIKISLLHAVTKLAEKLENLRDHLHFISSLLTAPK
jgi:hypothetical protein